MKKLATLAALMTAVAVLDGCSAGGTQGNKPTGSGTTTPTPSPAPTPTPAVPTMTLALSSSSVTTLAPATVKATVLDSTGAALPGVVVNFAVASAIGKLATPSALTDSTGVATDTLSPATGATTAAADTITATSTVNSTALTASAGYQTSLTTSSFTSFTAPDLSGALAAYSQTNLQLVMSGVTASSPANITVTSDCVIAGKATITPASITSPTGTVTFTYQDTGGCGSTKSSDNVTVTVTGATPPSTTLQLPLATPAATSLAFQTATNNPIFLKGSGGTVSSVVTFKVVDIAGNPLPNQPVTMNLTTFAGGLTIDGGSAPVTKSSDGQGLVSVIVSAGTVPTPVRVQAALGNDINGANNAVSSALAVGTGLPSEAGFSLAETIFNMEGYNYDGSWNSFTVTASDRLHNPIPQNTAISFVAESGVLPSSVLTPSIAGGGLSVVSVNFASQTSSQPLDGHVTVLAYAIGEENFTDTNGNNVWDAGEPFEDLGDPFLDKLFTGVFDQSAGDQYFSVNGSAHGGSSVCPTTSNPSNIPSMANTCTGVWSNKGYVRRALETILSTSSANPIWALSINTTSPDYFGVHTYFPGSCTATPLQLGSAASSAVDTFSLNDNPVLYLGAPPANSVVPVAGSVIIILSDANPVRLNPLPIGATVTLDSNEAITIPNTLTATSLSVPFTLAPNASASHTLKIVSAGPIQQDGKTHSGGVTTTLTFTIQYSAPPATTSPTPATCPA